MIEFRGDSVFISGYVNATEKESHFLPSPKGRFKEIILPKAFERALKRAKDVTLLFNHDETTKLGSLQSGNLKLYEDAIGLKAEAEIRDLAFIENAKKRGFLQGWSFGFIERKSHSEKGKDGIERRRIEDLDLLEVSLLSVKPAYPATSVEIRSEGMLERRYSDFEMKTQKSTVDFSRYENEIRFLKLKGLNI